MGDLLNKQTGKVESIPDNQLGDAFASGNFQAKPGTMIPVIRDDGTHGMMPAELVSGAKGYRVATAVDLAEDAKQQQYGEGMGTVRAGAEGAARGLSFGLSDPALAAVGADAEGMRERKDRNPVVAGVTEVAGAVAPLLLTGGASAPEQVAAVTARSAAARALGAIPRASSALGHAAESGALKLLGTTAETAGFLRKAAATGVGGAVEGALYEGGKAVSDATLNDEDLTAERVIAGMKNGAMLGGAAGGTLSLAGSAVGGVVRGVSSGGKRLLNAVRGGEAEVLPGVSSSASRATVDGTAEAGLSSERNVTLTTEQPGTPGIEPGFAQKALEGRRAVRELDKLQETATRDISRLGTENESALNSITNDMSIARKNKAIGAAMREENTALTSPNIEERLAAVDAAATDADAIVANLKAKIDDAAGEGGRTVSTRDAGAAKKLKGFIKKAQDDILDAYASGADDAGQRIHGAVDQLKRHVMGTGASLGGRAADAESAVIGDMLRGESMKLAEHLVNPELYGEAATAIQRVDNEKWVNWFDTAREFEQHFTSANLGGARLENWRKANVVDNKKLLPHLRAAGSATGEQIDSVFLRHMQASRELVEQLGASHGATAGEAAKIAKFADNTRKMESAYQVARDTAGKARAHAELEAELANLPFGTAALKTTVNVAERAQSFARARNAANVEASSMADQVRTVRKRAETLVKRTNDAVEGMFKATKRAVPVAAAASSSTGAVSYADRREKFNEKVARVKELAADPSMLATRVHSAGGEALDASPRYLMAFAGAQARGVAFLQSKLPAVNMPSSLIRPDLDKVARANDREMSKWMRYARAVENPETVLSDMERGDLTREGVEALQAVYPKMYADLSERVMRYVADSDETPAYSQVVQMSILFGKPLHPSLEPKFIAKVQANYVAQAEKQKNSGQSPLAPSARSAPNTSDAYQTKAQRLSA